MSSDKREMILLRLEAILQEQAPSGSGISVYRNRAELEDNELPAYVLLDGGEKKSIGLQSDKRAPPLMVITPQVFYVPVPPENALNTGLGSQVSNHRAILLKAIRLDSQLQSLVGENGYVEYLEMETDLQTGGEVKGQFRMDWAVAFMLNFNKL